jgi:putative sigma-54 modulation protein|tara:strand:+ start:440 stop:982 length:543 start_codon:yes stop_codon:yes gene_type:complete
MEPLITGKNIELPEELRLYIKHKLGRLDRHLANITEAKVEIAEEKTRSPQNRFVAQVTVAGNNTLLRSEERGESIFTAIDRVVATMKRRIEHHKGKLRHRGKGSSSARSKLVKAEETTLRSKVVKVKQFALKPMSIAEATDQLELLGHDFFLFFNPDTEVVNLLYRRKDGNYGLIEPELE